MVTCIASRNIVILFTHCDHALINILQVTPEYSTIHKPMKVSDINIIKHGMQKYLNVVRTYVSNSGWRKSWQLHWISCHRSISLQECITGKSRVYWCHSIKCKQHKLRTHMHTCTHTHTYTQLHKYFTHMYSIVYADTIFKYGAPSICRWVILTHIQQQ